MGASLGRLRTDLGERSTYDAASQCSRCGYCEQSCPTYVATGQESKSPRGRNQLVRLLIEGKLQDPAAAREALSTCLLCGGCQTTCYAHVPTPDIVLEGRRLLGADKPVPWLARTVTAVLFAPAWFRRLLLKAAFLGKRLGVSKLVRPLLGGLGVADAHVDRTPLRFAEELLSSRPPSGAWTYFAACGPNYVYPEVAQATAKALDAQLGPGGFLRNGCCGLVPYNYGSLEEARELARAVIEKADGRNEPLVADCSSCAAFLKSYPQLFLDDPVWKAKAEAFSARVKDVVELLDFPKPDPSVVYHESCRACHGQGLKAPQGYRTPDDGQACCGGAGAFSFAHPELSEELLEKKVEKIRATGAKVVLASSTSCLLQLARGLRNYYPGATVKHVSEFAAFSDDRGAPDGSTPRA